MSIYYKNEGVFEQYFILSFVYRKNGCHFKNEFSFIWFLLLIKY